MWTAFLGLFSWVGKIPAPVKKWAGIVLVALAFAWVVYSAGADDVKDKAAVKEAVALKEQAEAHAAKMTAVVETMSQANAAVSKTEVRVIREVADARRELDALPNADVPVDADSWRVVHDRIERMRLHPEDDSADPPIGIARPVG